MALIRRVGPGGVTVPVGGGLVCAELEQRPYCSDLAAVSRHHQPEKPHNLPSVESKWDNMTENRARLVADCGCLCLYGVTPLSFAAFGSAPAKASARRHSAWPCKSRNRRLSVVRTGGSERLTGAWVALLLQY